jgi:4,4'-diaponeurosporenoate glycosyltransferase
VCAVWVTAWVLAAAQLRAVLRRAGSFRWWTWALFPLPLLAFDVVFARSAAQTVIRRSVRWRGREVDLRRRGSAGQGA